MGNRGNGLRGWTEADVAAYYARRGVPPPADGAAGAAGVPAAVGDAPAKVKEPNKTERRYEVDFLRLQKHRGEVKDYGYERLTLVLFEALPGTGTGSRRTRFTPDWHCILPDGRTRLVEVKGAYAYEGALDKLKAAAALYPDYEFYLARWAHGEWTVTRVVPM
jgi:hypothetical protein